MREVREFLKKHLAIKSSEIKKNSLNDQNPLDMSETKIQVKFQRNSRPFRHRVEIETKKAAKKLNPGVWGGNGGERVQIFRKSF